MNFQTQPRQAAYDSAPALPPEQRHPRYSGPASRGSRCQRYTDCSGFRFTRPLRTILDLIEAGDVERGFIQQRYARPSREVWLLRNGCEA